MKALALILVLHISFVHIISWKSPKFRNDTEPSAQFDNPNYIRDRFKHLVYKPAMPTKFRDRFKKTYTPAWMDYCDPYHCNDYHRVACGINRRQLVFKWFQSGCHIILNNQCADFRGTLKYDQTDPKFCRAFIMSVRGGCHCEPGGPLACAVSNVDNRVTLFRDRCALQEANCAPNTFDEFEEVDMGLCTYYLKEAALKINEDAQYSVFFIHLPRAMKTSTLCMNI